MTTIGLGQPSMDTISQIAPLIEMSYKVKALIYGEAGVGKTVFACNSPNPLLLDCDGTGALSLLNHPELAARTMVLQVRKFNQMLDVLEAYKRGDPRLVSRETIIIDTLSELAKRHLDEFVSRERIANPQRDPVPFQRDYKFNTEGMRQLVIYFLELDVNLVCLAHAAEEKDERTGIIKTRPALTPKLAGTMEGVFDVFGYMTSDTDAEFNTTRALQIMPSRTIKAKTRIGGLPPLIAEPVFQHFIDRKAIMVDENRKYQHALQEQAAQAQQATQQLEPEQPPVVEPVVEQAPAFVGAAFNLDQSNQSAEPVTSTDG